MSKLPLPDAAIPSRDHFGHRTIFGPASNAISGATNNPSPPGRVHACVLIAEPVRRSQVGTAPGGAEPRIRHCGAARSRWPGYRRRIITLTVFFSRVGSFHEGRRADLETRGLQDGRDGIMPLGRHPPSTHERHHIAQNHTPQAVPHSIPVRLAKSAPLHARSHHPHAFQLHPTQAPEGQARADPT